MDFSIRGVGPVEGSVRALVSKIVGALISLDERLTVSIDGVCFWLDCRLMFLYPPIATLRQRQDVKVKAF